MPRRSVPIKHSELVSRFAGRLREVRESRGMTQLDLARKSHVTASYISRLEGGKIAPGIDMVERLAVALGVVATDLLPTTTTPDSVTVLRDQGKHLFDILLRNAERETWLKLNPLLALLVEASAKRD